MMGEDWELGDYLMGHGQEYTYWGWETGKEQDTWEDMAYNTQVFKKS